MTKQEISLARGNADAVALKKRFHNSQIHQRYLPKGQLAQQLYNSLETARCEIIGARNYRVRQQISMLKLLRI